MVAYISWLVTMSWRADLPSRPRVIMVVAEHMYRGVEAVHESCPTEVYMNLLDLRNLYNVM